MVMAMDHSTLIVSEVIFIIIIFLFSNKTTDFSHSEFELTFVY